MAAGRTRPVMGDDLAFGAVGVTECHLRCCGFHVVLCLNISGLATRSFRHLPILASTRRPASLVNRVVSSLPVPFHVASSREGRLSLQVAWAMSWLGFRCCQSSGDVGVTG